MVTKQSLITFKQLYYTKFHKELTDEQAIQQAIDLLNLMKILTKPNKKMTESI